MHRQAPPLPAPNPISLRPTWSWIPQHTVTLGLIHGSAPHAFVLCQLAGSTEVEGYPGVPLPPLAELVELHERISLTSRRAPVACIALNTRHLDDDGARAAIEAAAAGDGPRRRRPLPLRRGAAPGRRACASRGLGRLEVHDLAYAHTLMSLPIAALLMKSFFDDIPADLDSAAMIDGAGRFGCFRCLPAGARRAGRHGGALLHLLLDRVPDLAPAHHGAPSR